MLERGTSFEEIISSIEQGGLLAVLQHPNQRKYPNQRIWVVKVREYAHLVPFVESESEIFLKTIMPSRNFLLRVTMKTDRKYEGEIARSFELGEWKSVKNSNREMERYRKAASETLLKNRRVNIRISAMDLEGLQTRAAAEGLPYQTLMASVLHKYVSGRLVDGPKRITSRSSVRATKRRSA